MSLTASELPELHIGPTRVGANLPVIREDLWRLVEQYSYGLTSLPTPSAKTPVLRQWVGSKQPVWVHLYGTGATMADPDLPRHLTMHYIALDTLSLDIFEILAELDRLGWNSRGEVPPKPSALRRAKQWVQEMYKDAERLELGWLAPLITVDEFGDIVFEWWKYGRKITVYIGPDITEYIKVSGPDMDADMEDGEVETRRDRLDLWRWLMSVD